MNTDSMMEQLTGMRDELRAHVETQATLLAASKGENYAQCMRIWGTLVDALEMTNSLLSVGANELAYNLLCDAAKTAAAEVADALRITDVDAVSKAVADVMDHRRTLVGQFDPGSEPAPQGSTLH